MKPSRLTGAVPALAVAAAVTAVLGLAACGSSSTPAPTQEELNAQACASYCTTLTGACTTPNAQFATQDACNAYCVRARGTPEIWSAGAGYFARIEYREAPGLRVEGRAPTIEDVADNIEKIADLSTNRVFRTSSEEVAAVVGS